MLNIGISMRDVMNILAHRIGISGILPLDRKYYLIHAILHGRQETSSSEIAPWRIQGHPEAYFKINK